MSESRNPDERYIQRLRAALAAVEAERDALAAAEPAFRQATADEIAAALRNRLAMLRDRANSAQNTNAAADDRVRADEVRTVIDLVRRASRSDTTGGTR